MTKLRYSHGKMWTSPGWERTIVSGHVGLSENDVLVWATTFAWVYVYIHISIIIISFKTHGQLDVMWAILTLQRCHLYDQLHLLPSLPTSIIPISVCVLLFGVTHAIDFLNWECNILPRKVMFYSVRTTHWTFISNNWNSSIRRYCIV
jgi:hypothetical protein